jgi:hypothetical protein
MAIGYTGSNGNETAFEYTPVDPQDDMMRQLAQQSQQAFYPPPPQPRGPTPYWENPETYYPQQQQIDPIAQAKAATMAAQKFIAFRGYQSDLKEGMAAADAFAKWGPMLVADTSLAPAMKAMQPQPNYTYDQAHNAWTSPGQKPVLGKPIVEAPRWIPANPETGEPAHYESGGKAQFPPTPKAPSAPKLDQITMADYNDARKEFTTALKEYNKEDNSEEIKLDARKRMDAAKIRMNNISNRGQQSALSSPAAPAPKQPSAPTAPVVIRLTKDGKKAEFDAATKKFLRYAE